MRIGIIVEIFPVISETFISNKIKYLQKNGHTIFIFCAKENKDLFQNLFKEAKNIKIIILSRQNFIQYFFTHPWIFFSTGFNQHSLRKKLFSVYKVRMLNFYKCDVLHFEFSGIAVSYLACLKKLQAKTVVSCRGTAENVNLALYPSRQQNIEELFSKVDAIHCVSAALKKVILPYCKNPEKIFINHPGIDTKLFTKKNNFEKNDPPIILSIGRFIFQKGFLTGILAIQKLKQYTSNFKWIIAGGGLQYEELFFYITALELQQNVILKDKKNKDEIMELYNNATIFFLPSVTEGIANVALEAMSMGIPVVATKSGGMEEVIENNISGLLSALYDDEDLANNLLQLLIHADLKEKIALAGEQKAKQNFDISNRIAKFEQVYKNLL